ncbi:Lipase [Rhodopirellula islandica]|uniref:Lipase n=1 Tax=Rhodopirellula islandica TaxID=595434 RepID=A0A0J1B5R8_RHOIS|nr:Lipase [Rhodopirellula islandica]
MFTSILFVSPGFTYAQDVSSAMGTRTYQLDGIGSASFKNIPALLREKWNTRAEVRWDIAKPLSAIAYQVYEEEPIITRYFLSSMGFDLVTEIRHESMYAYVAATDDVMVIAFRGTNLTSLSDWHVNWRYKQVLHHGHYFHEGFVEKYLAMSGKIRESIIQHKPKHIWITGHSLGGALATICAVDLAHAGQMQPNLCTFGQPRVTDSAGAEWLNKLLLKRYARFVNGSDIVPSLPPTYPYIRTYGHAGDLYAFGMQELTISDSSMTAPATTTAFCDQCGRPAPTHPPAPIYQSTAELPPLDQQEYEALLRQEQISSQMHGKNDAGENAMRAGLFDYFLDHKMRKYLRAIESFGSAETTLTIPGR